MAQVLSAYGTPQIDGIFGTTEWANAAQLNFSARLPGGGMAPATLFVMNDAANLYLAVRVTRKAPDAHSSLIFEFDNDDDRVAENGDDRLVLSEAGFSDEFKTNAAPCAAGQPPASCAVPDGQGGGTNDGTGVFGNGGGFSTFELRHPLRPIRMSVPIAPGTSLPSTDFSRRVGDALGFFLQLSLTDTRQNVGSVRVPGRGFRRILIASGPVVVMPANTADLAVTVADERDPTAQGRPLRYTVMVTNQGPSPTSGNLHLVLQGAAVAGPVAPTAATCALSSSGASCSLASLASGASAVVDWSVTPAAIGTLTLAATVVGSLPDPFLGNNSANANTQVDRPDLVVTKRDVVDPVWPGLNANYSIAVTNTGTVEATGVTLTDYLRVTATFVSATPSQGTCPSPSGGVLTCLLGSVPAGGSALVTLLLKTPVVPVSSNPRISFSSSRAGNFVDIYTMYSDGTQVDRVTNTTAMSIHPGDPAWSPDGTTFAFTWGDLYLVNANGTGMRQLTTGFRASSPAWSHDGTRIAFVRDRDLTNQYLDGDIWVIDAYGSAVTQLTANAGGSWDSEPAWSPDGSKIAFARDGGDLYTMNPDGSNAAKLPLMLGGAVGAPAWSPDGTKLAFYGPGNNWAKPHVIWMSNADGTNPHRVTTRQPGEWDAMPSWSPDGTRLAFISRRAPHLNDSEIYVINVDGTGEQNISNNMAPPYPSSPGSSEFAPQWERGSAIVNHVQVAANEPDKQLANNQAIEGTTLGMLGARLVLMSDANNDHVIGAGDTPLAAPHVGRWDGAYTSTFAVHNAADPANFIESDPARFYVQLTDAGANTNPAVAEQVVVRLGTIGGAGAIDDDLTSVTLVETGPNTGVFVSRSQLLTSADANPNPDDGYAAHDGLSGAVGDDSPGDRTHRAEIDGAVRVEYGPPGTIITKIQDFPVCNRYPAVAEERRKLELRVTIFNEPYTDTNGNGGYDVGEPFIDLSNGATTFGTSGQRGPLVSNAYVDEQIRLANLSWAQACIKVVVVGTKSVDASKDSNGDDILKDAVFSQSEHSIVLKQYGAAATVDVAEVYLVPDMQGLGGYTPPASDKQVLEPQVPGISEKSFSFINSNVALCARGLAHEMGHLLTNYGDNFPGQQFLFPQLAPGCSDDVNKFRRMTAATAADARATRPPGYPWATGNRLLKYSF